MPSPRTPTCAVIVLAALGGATPLAAQSCDLGVVSRIVVDNQSIFAEDEIEGERFEWAFALANRLHIRTRDRFIRRELLLSEGDCYDPFRVADSERILRNFDFISEAEAFGVRMPDGSWEVRVLTEDEWSTKLEATGEFDDGVRLRSVSVSEENLLGRGMLVQAFYSQREAQRLTGLRFHTPRLLNSRTDFAVAVGETRAGTFFDTEIVYPFLGELGRIGVRQRWSRREDFFQYSDAGSGSERYVLLPTRSEFAELAVARRWGEPGDLLVGGIGLSKEVIEFPDFQRRTEVVEEGRGFDDGVSAEEAVLDELRTQTRFASGTRLNFLFQHRAIDFVQRTGLDALRGVQDLAVGSEVSLTLGRTIFATAGSGVPDDLYTRVRIYAAGSPQPFTFVFDAVVEARQIFSGSEVGEDGWRDTMAELDVLAYWQPGFLDRHTFVGRLSGVGGWAVDQPFQLTLGGRTGVRGYGSEAFPGARRVKLSIEDRIYLGWPAPDLFDLGVTLFADAGRMWGGEVPFGVDSGWKGTIGGGIRFGFPSGTRGVVRVDLAFAVDGTGVGSPVLRISALDLLGLRNGLDDPQLARSRRIVVGPDRFSPIR